MPEGYGKGIDSQGLCPGLHRPVEVTVKSGWRPDGSQDGLANFVFDPSTTPAAPAFPVHTCNDYHHMHADVDSV